MTILNTASDGFFNVLIVLHRSVALHGPMDRDRLIDLCSAGSEADVKRIRETLLRWTQLGLFKESDSGKLALERVDKDQERLPAICRRYLFNEVNNQNFWDSEGSRAADFTRALTFILAQDIYTHEFDTRAQVESLERLQVRDEARRILQNDVRWNGLRFWGDYLGFFCVGQRRSPDPTAAVRDELPNVFARRKELSARDFMERLADCLPVLDGGSYRLEIESILDPSEWQAPARPDLLSTSLSRSIWRLSQPGGRIRLEGRADAGTGRTLQRSGGRDWKTFTHVVLN